MAPPFAAGLNNPSQRSRETGPHNGRFRLQLNGGIGGSILFTITRNPDGGSRVRPSPASIFMRGREIHASGGDGLSSAVDGGGVDLESRVRFRA